MDGKSLNLTEERIEQLKQILPEAFSEGKIDFLRLKEILGETLAPDEHYELSWAGKAEARREIQRQTTHTLVADLENSVDFENAQNLFIEGENLEVLRILQKSYFGRVKMIYIDPPYNTGNDSFVYPDDYSERLQEYNKRTGVTDEEGYLNKQDLWRKNSRENGQFHSVWLSMMYPRLYLARNLLREDGVIFVSIDDNEASNLKLMMNEIFGEDNFIANIVWRRTVSKAVSGKGIAVTHDHILCYGKSEKSEIKKLPVENEKGYKNPDNDPRGVYKLQKLERTLEGARPTMTFTIESPNGVSTTKTWSVTPTQYKNLLEDNRISFSKSGMPYYKQFLSEYQGVLPDTWWDKTGGYNQDASKELKALFEGLDIFNTPKPTSLIKLFLLLTTNPYDLVLDFFGGSASTAHAILDLNEEDNLNRKFICIQLPEKLEEDTEAYKAGYRTVADISRARIRKVIEKMQKSRAEQLALTNQPQVLGFRAFKIAPSNFKNWRGDVQGEELLKQLALFKQSEKEGSLRENMLIELLLKLGLPLTTKVETFSAGKGWVFMVAEAKLLLFFDTYNKAVKEIIHEKAPRRVVCLDSAFKGKDEDISNFKLELREAGIELTIL